MRAAACCLAAVLAVLLAPVSRASADEAPYGLARLERVAAALKSDPLFVDDDFADVVGGGDRKRIRKALKETSGHLGVPVFVVLLPNPSDSESQGYDDVFLHGLHGQLGEDGLYLMADHHADLEIVPFEVSRDLGYSIVSRAEAGPADDRKPFADLSPRIERALAEVAGSPPGEPSTPRLYSTADPFGQKERPPLEPEIWPSFFGGLLIVGPLAALVLYWAFLAVRGTYRLWRRPPPASSRSRTGRRYPSVSAEPRVRKLRSQADKELARLAALLPPSDDAQGRLVALHSYDAARILSDDVGRRPGPRDAAAALDLVGVIVLARQGREVLEKGLARPLVPCRVNPLHGPGVLKRAVTGLPTGKVCRSCADADAAERLRRVLKLPGGRRYHEMEGRWKSGFGGQNLATRVLESLGVG